ncbi:hypothetical protein OAK17_07720 [Alphaproteobacteria bacterium]|nr:hypothetical protein [Alphaproteobacteria bacterium]
MKFEFIGSVAGIFVRSKKYRFLFDFLINDSVFQGSLFRYRTLNQTINVLIINLYNFFNYKLNKTKL